MELDIDCGFSTWVKEWIIKNMDNKIYFILFVCIILTLSAIFNNGCSDKADIKCVMHEDVFIDGDLIFKIGYRGKLYRLNLSNNKYMEMPFYEYYENRGFVKYNFTIFNDNKIAIEQLPLKKNMYQINYYRLFSFDKFDEVVVGLLPGQLTTTLLVSEKGQYLFYKKSIESTRYMVKIGTMDRIEYENRIFPIGVTNTYFIIEKNDLPYRDDTSKIYLAEKCDLLQTENWRKMFNGSNAIYSSETKTMVFTKKNNGDKKIVVYDFNESKMYETKITPEEMEHYEPGYTKYLPFNKPYILVMKKKKGVMPEIIHSIQKLTRGLHGYAYLHKYIIYDYKKNKVVGEIINEPRLTLHSYLP
jgi:hypothetical protein